MDHATAVWTVEQMDVPHEQRQVYLKVLDVLNRCDLPADVKTMLRGFAIQRWALEAAAGHAAP